uniref:Leucine-rich repeat protein n=1 Tax=Bodo saltans TaxID=75058 RepID=B6DTA2_BODSA|nr:hypothetical protein [Bodo saltans]
MNPSPPSGPSPMRASGRRRATSSSNNSSSTTTAAPVDNSDFLDEAFWNGRSLYPVPEPPSGSHCVLQNDLLCTFGGLQAECPSMLFQIVPRDVAVQPSTRMIYVRACTKKGLTPLPNFTNQFSTTPGRYMLLVLECSGTPISADVMETLLPVMKANRETLRIVNFRNCRLHDGAWELLATHLAEHGRHFAKLESLEISCNLLTDEDVSSVLPLIVASCPSLHRIGLLKNSFSRTVATSVTQTLHERSRALSPSCNLFGGSMRPDSRRSERQQTPRRGGEESSPSSLRRSISPLRTSSRIMKRGESSSLGDAHPPSQERMGSNAYLSLQPPPYQPTGDEATIPKISKNDFQHAVAMYRQYMAMQTALLDPHTLQQHQPAIFDVFRRQTSAMPVMEHVTLPRYLCACFPACTPQQMMYALGFYCEYSLTTAVRKVTHDGLRPEQKAEVMRIFTRLDKNRSGILPLEALLPPRATPADIEDTKTMLKRLNIVELTFDSFAKICAPYLVETKRRRRLR